ncbi:HAMP domain-containing sensor histidine kinase [Paenibacillus sp. YPG26]|uniref:sensor histidine kinase n=1 Tax=Paenibacillus sp. YPG26 TaxID=2878915 RepID=UPI00203B1878|nr:HAMP domain-containing sensor histidine kinase [Paenibacillus sp. YPG26]USB31791.1 HAMP domain-containing histidine kinase [Paenibacillus sp. YPG26]
MSIRLKLILSYAAMLVVPLIMMVITAILLTFVFKGDLQALHEKYGFSQDYYEDHNLERLVRELGRTAKISPSTLTDTEYLEEIEDELELSNSNLIVRKQDQFVYVSPALNNNNLLSLLAKYEDKSTGRKNEALKLGTESLELTQYNFIYDDRHPGTVFIITNVNSVVHFVQKFAFILFLSLIFILILTHTLLTYFVSRSIIRPLRKLKDATKRIKSGDLDFDLQITNKDEIGELSQAFEQMRVRLKESIETQHQYEENRKELVSNISHDLRTPLTAIRGYIAGIGDGIADTPDKVQKYMNIISLKAEEMDHLIDELFLYSKLDLNRLPFHFEKINLHSFLMDWSEELRFELNKQGVQFACDLQVTEQTEISIDRDKIRRVFSNIISNCLKYMNKSEKEIQLRAYESRGYLNLLITDNGQGIDAEALPYVFERFYREDASRNSDTGGSGLGLAIARQMIEGHYGSIQAESVKGVGTSIKITLPLIRNEEGDQA